MKKSLLIALLPLLPSCAPPASAPPPQAPEAPAQPAPPAPAPEAAPQPAAAAETPEAAPAAEPEAQQLASALHEHALLQEQVGFYAVLTPPGYDDPANAKQKYPIVVLLPSAGATEAETAKKADALGRDGVIYVIPRAPYPSSTEGYTASPAFPQTWGQPGTETFPQKDVDSLKLSKLYTAQIASALKDARKRYRTAWGKVTVYGEGEGGTYAHNFAAHQPWLVKAYFASGGQYDETTEGKSGAAQVQGLKSNKISAMLVHAEADPTAKVDSAKKLDELLTKHRVDHELSLIQGSSPVLTAELRDKAKRFVRHHCCGEPLEAPPPAAPAPAPAAAKPAPAPAGAKPAPASPAAPAKPATPAAAPAAKPPAPAKPAPPPPVAKAPAPKTAPATPPKAAAPPAAKAAPAARSEDKTAAKAAPPKTADKPTAGKAAPPKDVPAKATAPAKPGAAKPEAAKPAPPPPATPPPPAAPAAPPSK